MILLIHKTAEVNINISKLKLVCQLLKLSDAFGL